MVSPEDEQVFAYTRTLGKTTALVLLNFKETEATISLDQFKFGNGFKSVIGNYAFGDDLTSGSAVLKGYEGKVYIN